LLFAGKKTRSAIVSTQRPQTPTTKHGIMSMDSLGKDLISKILDFALGREGHDIRVGKENAHLACVSRAWQALIEEHTFHTITLTQHDVAAAARIVTPARQLLVGEVRLNIELDSYDEEARWRVETAAEQQRNSEVFTAAVRGVFNLLSTWRPTRLHDFTLALRVWSPTDINRLSPEAAEDLVRRLPFSPLRRYERSLIQFLDDADSLPALNHITDLQIQRYPDDSRGRNLYRAVDPSSVPVLVSKCREKLKWLTLYLMDWPRGALEERKRRRKTLAAVIDGLPKRLERLHLAYWGCPPRDENHDPPNLLDLGETEDALSLSLRRFYRRPNTGRVNITHTILGPELFIPEGEVGDELMGRDNYDSDQDEWYFYDDCRPSAELNDLYVDVPKVTPDGRWLHWRYEGKNAEQIAWEEWDIRDTSDSSEEEDEGVAIAAGPTDPDPELDHPAYANKHRFRIYPIWEVLNPLLKGVARSWSQMPSLSSVEWSIASDWPAHRVEYIARYDDDGGGTLDFRGFGFYEDGEELIDTGEPLVDEDVVEYFKEVLSEREPKGEIEVYIE
jgi:hypothetical protein